MVEPLGQRILVEDIKETHSGVIQFAPNVKEKPTLMGRVVAISSEIISPKVDKGDVIYRGEWIGQMVKDGDKEYRVMAITDVLGRVK